MRSLFYDIGRMQSASIAGPPITGPGQPAGAFECDEIGTRIQCWFLFFGVGRFAVIRIRCVTPVPRGGDAGDRPRRKTSTQHTIAGAERWLLRHRPALARLLFPCRRGCDMPSRRPKPRRRSRNRRTDSRRAGPSLRVAESSSRGGSRGAGLPMLGARSLLA